MLDTHPHVITSVEITEVKSVHVVMPDDIPNPAWLSGGMPSYHQQRWGANLLGAHGIVLFPSAVSKLSWNLVFEPIAARDRYRLRLQTRLSVDTRLNWPA